MAKVGRTGFVITKTVLKKAERLAAQGLTKAQIAQSMGIHRATLFRKINESSDFSDAIKTGQAQGVADVTNALFERAMGCNVTEERFIDGKLITATKYFPPDATSCIFFLKNRDPENWKDRQYVDETHHAAPADIPINKDMTPQQAAETYADTLRNGTVGNVVPIKRRQG